MTELEFRIATAEGGAGDRDLSMALVAELLRQWSDLVESVASGRRPPSPDDHSIILRRVTPGSIVAASEMPLTHLRAVANIGDAAAAGSLGKLPAPARPFARTFLKTLERAGQQFSFAGDPSSKVRGVILRGPWTEVPPAFIEGETSFTGTLTSVGGKTPNVHIDTGSGKSVIITLSEQQAQGIAKLLYSTVTVDVRAFWNLETDDLDRCTLLDWRPGPRLSLVEGLRNYTAKYGSDWPTDKGLDWLAKLRNEDEE